MSSLRLRPVSREDADAVVGIVRSLDEAVLGSSDYTRADLGAGSLLVERMEDELRARGVGEASWRYRARVIVHASADHVRGRLPIPVEVEPLGEDRCAFEPGSDHPEMLALYLGMLDADFTIVDSPELLTALRKLTLRYQRAIDLSQRETGGSPVTSTPCHR